MPSFYDKAKKVIKENQDMLNVFEEFDRTGKMKKRTYKVRANFTIDEDLLNLFRSYCKKNNINMSGRIEKYIEKEIKNK